MSNENEGQNPYAAPKHNSIGVDSISIDGLKTLSKQQLKGKHLKMVLAVFIYSLIIYPLQFIFTDYSPYFLNPFYTPLMSILATIFVFLVAGAFELGFAGFYLRRVRGEEIAIANIFEGFKKFFKALGLMFFYTLFVMLWSMLLLVPGIIKGLSYSMAFFILRDNPEIGVLGALKKSQQMMNGHKWLLFLLYLSFIGWFLLGILSFGIGLLWVVPYFELSIANLYQKLKEQE